MIGKFLVAWVDSRADLKALIGDRFTPDRADPTAPYPYVTYQITGDDQVRSLAGPSGLRRQMVQIDVVDTNYQRAVTVAALIHGGQDDRRLDGYAGELGGVDVKEGRWLDGRVMYDEPRAGEEQGARRLQLDFKFTYAYGGGS